jgi:putative flippase GtrA
VTVAKRGSFSHYIARLFSRAMVRWWIVGIVFMGVNVGSLYVLVDLLTLPVIFSTLIAAEAGALLRFIINDRWVFNQRGITWRRLWQYHVAIAGSFTIWWACTNVIVLLGGHYLVASIIGMGCSVLLSMITNFFWIWSHPTDPALTPQPREPKS